MYNFRSIRAFNLGRQPVRLPSFPGSAKRTTPSQSPQFKTESIEKFISRGGKITVCPPRYAANKTSLFGNGTKLQSCRTQNQLVPQLQNQLCELKFRLRIIKYTPWDSRPLEMRREQIKIGQRIKNINKQIMLEICSPRKNK